MRYRNKNTRFISSPASASVSFCPWLRNWPLAGNQGGRHSKQVSWFPNLLYLFNCCKSLVIFNQVQNLSCLPCLFKSYLPCFRIDKVIEELEDIKENVRSRPGAIEAPDLPNTAVTPLSARSVPYHYLDNPCNHKKGVQCFPIISAPNCIKHFHWTIRLFWPIRFDVTIVSSGNNCNVKPD